MNRRQTSKSIVNKIHYNRSIFGKLLRRFSWHNLFWCSIRLFFYSVFAAIAAISILASHKQYKAKTADFNKEFKPEIDFPDITICAPSIMTPKTLSDIFPQFDAFVKKINRMDNDSLSHNRKLLRDQLQYYESIMLDRFDLKEITNVYSVKSKDIIRSCRYYPMRYRFSDRINILQDQHSPYINCTSIRPSLKSIFAGKKCWTFFSKFSSKLSYWKHRICRDHYEFPNYKEICEKLFSKMVSDFKPSIDIELYLDEKLWMNWADPSGIIMTVHPPEILPELKNFIFYRVKNNHLLEISFTKEMINESIYYRQCNQPDDNDGDSFTMKYGSRDGCINACINDNFFQNNITCYPYFHMITMAKMYEWEKIRRLCSHYQQNYRDYLHYRDQCLWNSSCLIECIKNNYDIDIQSTLIEPPSYLQMNSSTSSTYVQLQISISTNPFKTYSHRYLMSTNEIFGIEGGHIGLWLGLSVISVYNVIFNYLIPFFRLICCIAYQKLRLLYLHFNYRIHLKL